MQDSKSQTTEDNQLLGKLARALYASQVDGKFTKEGWEAARAEYRKQARALLRTMDKHGLQVSLTTTA